MGRPNRIQIANGVYHVTTRSAGQTIAFRDAEDYERFLRITGHVVDRLGWRVHIYCLMPTHWHLVLTTVQPNLAAGAHILNGHYARTFNARHGRCGHLFGARYRNPLITTERHAVRVCSYVPVNPVDAGLCETPESWRWSSYAATVGLRKKPWFLDDEWVLRNFDDRDLETARRRYKAYVEAAADEARGAWHLGTARASVVPGTSNLGTPPPLVAR